HAVRILLQADVLDEVVDDPVDRKHGHDDQHDEHDPVHHGHVFDHVGEAHLRQGLRAVGGSDRGVGGFLQHDAYLLDLVVLDGWYVKRVVRNPYFRPRDGSAAVRG